MEDFDIDEYRSKLRHETSERLKFLLREVGRNGESERTKACEQAIRDELATREEAARQPYFL